VFYHTFWMNSVPVSRRWEGSLDSSNQNVLKMVGSIGMRRGFINRGDWSDGLERQGSNPWPTTILLKGESSWGCECTCTSGSFVVLG